MSFPAVSFDKERISLLKLNRSQFGSAIASFCHPKTSSKLPIYRAVSLHKGAFAVDMEGDLEVGCLELSGVAAGRRRSRVMR